MSITPFTGGSKSAQEKLNRLVEFYNCLQNIRGDGLIKVSKTAGGITFSLDIDQTRALIVKSGSGTGIHRAFCKTDAGAAATIVCYLDTDVTGKEVTVTCAIAGGGNLDEAEPHLTDGLEIPVWYDSGIETPVWKCLGVFQHREPCA